MTDESDNPTAQEFAEGTSEFIKYLEEDDGKEVVWTWRALIENTVMLYDFRTKA